MVQEKQKNRDDSGWTFQVGGAAGRLCARGSGVFSGRARAGWEPDAATTRMTAGWESEPRGGRGPLAARPTFQVSLGPGGGSGAGLRESRSAGAARREG